MSKEYLTGSERFLNDFLIVCDIDDRYGYLSLNIFFDGILLDIDTNFVLVLKYSLRLYCFIAK